MDEEICGAPGREEEDNIPLACDLPPHNAINEDHHAYIPSPYGGEPQGEMWWKEPDPLGASKDILRQITLFQIEANDSGGVDINDLVWRLQMRGYTFPETEED